MAMDHNLATLKAIVIPELFERIMGQVPLNHRLSMRASCRLMYGMITNTIEELEKPEQLIIKSVTFSKLKNNLHVAIDVDNVAMAQHFVPIINKANSIWKRKNPKDVRCWCTFPNEGPRDFPLFEGAKISHFQIDKRIPMHFFKEDAAWMKTLLRGTEIDMMTIVLDARTMPQIPEVPELLCSVNAKHVEFVIQSTIGTGKQSFATMIRREIPHLVVAGITQVTISVDRMFGNGSSTCNAQKIDFKLLWHFIRGGIHNVTFDGEFEAYGTDVDRDFEKFMKKIMRSSLPVTMTFRSHHVHRGVYRNGQTFKVSDDHPVYKISIGPESAATSRGSPRVKDELTISMQ